MRTNAPAPARRAAIAPLGQFGRGSRSVILVLFLLGGLFPSPLPISNIAIAMLLGTPVIAYEVLRWLPRLHPIILFVAPAFALLALHAAIVPPVTAYGHSKLSHWLTLTLFASAAACLIRDRRAMLTFYRTWMIGSSALAIATIISFEGLRAATFDTNPIWLARAVSTGMIVIIWLIWFKRGSLVILVPAAILHSVALLMAGSRGPLLGCVVAIALLTLLSASHRFVKIATTVLATAMGYWALLDANLLANSRLSSLATEGIAGDAARASLWADTLPVIAQSPGGVGVGNWGVAAQLGAIYIYPHNIFLEAFAELGWLLGAALVVVVVVVATKLVRSIRQEPVMSLLLCTFAAEIVYSSVSGDLNAHSFFFTLTLGFLLTARAHAVVEEPPLGSPPPTTTVSLPIGHRRA